MPPWQISRLEQRRSQRRSPLELNAAVSPVLYVREGLRPRKTKAHLFEELLHPLSSIKHILAIRVVGQQAVRSYAQPLSRHALECSLPASPRRSPPCRRSLGPSGRLGTCGVESEAQPKQVRRPSVPHLDPTRTARSACSQHRGDWMRPLRSDQDLSHQQVQRHEVPFFLGEEELRTAIVLKALWLEVRSGHKLNLSLEQAIPGTRVGIVRHGGPCRCQSGVGGSLEQDPALVELGQPTLQPAYPLRIASFGLSWQSGHSYRRRHHQSDGTCDLG